MFIAERAPRADGPTWDTADREIPVRTDLDADPVTHLDADAAADLHADPFTDVNPDASADVDTSAADSVRGLL